jgi:hypothetical protein
MLGVKFFQKKIIQYELRKINFLSFTFLCASPSFLPGQYIRFQSPLGDSHLFSETLAKASSSLLLPFNETIPIRARNQALESSLSILEKDDSAKKNTGVSIDIRKFKDSSRDLQKMITGKKDSINFSLHLVEMLSSWETLLETKHLEINKSAFSGKHSNMAIDLGHFSVINSCTGGKSIQQQLSNASKEQVQEEENIFGAFCLVEPSQNEENRNSSVKMGLRSPSLFAPNRNPTPSSFSANKKVSIPSEESLAIGKIKPLITSGQRRARPNWSGAATVYNWEISNFNGTAGNGYDKFLFGNLDFSGGNKFKIQVLPVHATLPDNNITDSGNTAGFSSVQNTFQNKSFSFLNANGTITGLSGNVSDSFEIDSRAFSYYTGHWYGDWSVSHDGSGNFALDYVVVPEPSTYAMVFSLFGFLGLKKQNRNKLSRFLAHSFSFLLRFLNGKSFPHPITRK